MVRKALLGLALSCGAVIVVLGLLGFRPDDVADLFRKPYEEALKDGECLREMTVWVDGKELSGEHTFEMVVRNPTRRQLLLTGSWSEAPDRYRISPTLVVIAVPPGGSRTVAVHLTPVGARPVPVSRFKPPVFEGKWLYQSWAPPGKEPPKVEIPITRPLTVRRAFGDANRLVLIAYLALVLGIGFWAGRRIKGTASFFIADGKLNYVVVGLSILGTYLSALTMMALPGMSYGAHDWTYTVQLPCLVITAIVITGFVLPRYRASGIVSIYAYLEQRIHVSARLVAAVCFIVFSIGRMGLVLYLPALAFSTVTGAPLWMCILGMGAIVTVYTVVGGMRAVVWTDAIQVIIFVAGAFLTLGYIFHHIGVGEFVEIGLTHNKFRVLIPGFDVTKITTVWLILETIFQTIRIYGTQQDVAQRYMTTESTAKANRSVWIGILGYIPLGFIFYLIGTALFAFYKANPDVNLPGKADPMYPYFVVNHLPRGIAGLVIAAIFAAAMSSIDSCMNSSSAVCVEDFSKRFSRKPRSDRDYLRQARYLTVLWGLLATVMALMFMQVQYAQIVWGKLMGISTNGILGLMALAFLPFRVNKWAAMAGFVFSYFCLFVMINIGVNFLLWPVIGNLLCFFVALFLHPLFSTGEGTGGAEQRAA